MASFKTKAKKKITCDNRITLEAKHNEITELMDNDLKKLEMYKQDRTALKAQLAQLEKKGRSENLETILNLKDELRDLEEDIKKINNCEINYYLDNGNLLFDYFEKLNNTHDTPVNNIKLTGNSQNKSVMEYFNKNIKNIEKDTSVTSKDDIVDNYFFNTEENYLRQTSKVNVDFCRECNIEKTLYLSDGKIICQKCGDESSILIDSDKPSYKDPPREITYFSYKRINHFNEWLAQFQAKETTEIPQDVYDNILIELNKERIKDMNTLTPKKIREILKKLKRNKYYEHVPHIINKLNGVAPPMMTRETEEKLRRMFKEIQIPFHKFCPKDRKNFLSYSYVLRKFVELLELDEFIPCFILLKSREKCYQQDIIWKDICDYLNWEFIPSV